MSSQCREPLFSRRQTDGQLILSVAGIEPGDNDLVPIGGGVVLVRDRDGHVVALFVTDSSRVVPEALEEGLHVTLTFEAASDMGYLYVAQPGQHRVGRTVDACDGDVLVDLDSSDRMIGIEFFNATRWFCSAVLQGADLPGAGLTYGTPLFAPTETPSTD